MSRNRPLVLLVDNNVDNREMYAEYLRVCGFRVIACADSTASVELARARRPDIVLLELRMMGMNGAEVLTQLRRQPALAHVPIVALTSSVLSFERAAAMAAGFTELVPKPCFPEDLVRAITRLLGASGRDSRLRPAPRLVRRPAPTPDSPGTSNPPQPSR